MSETTVKGGDETGMSAQEIATKAAKMSWACGPAGFHALWVFDQMQAAIVDANPLTFPTADRSVPDQASLPRYVTAKFANLSKQEIGTFLQYLKGERSIGHTLSASTAPPNVLKEEMLKALGGGASSNPSADKATMATWDHTIDALEACLGMSNTEGPTVDWSRVNETMPAVTVNPESMALFEARRTSLRACLNELSVLMPSRAAMMFTFLRLHVDWRAIRDAATHPAVLRWHALDCCLSDKACPDISNQPQIELLSARLHRWRRTWRALRLFEDPHAACCPFTVICVDTREHHSSFHPSTPAYFLPLWQACPSGYITHDVCTKRSR
ncbi:uncharacterized protein MKK02DRAFT_30087 [Dioszegia hungarica]|uniref:Uncharacterized protein n=1 Tax=Dioszegia hungarica TaxID=4972 RepID=A0AA38LS56_9TREE|nr:uncharacterized protein MKK02DRAFT_30087 [Dioszegia hungarica]KAI9632219.1 hypothetical protein MKK02DRAFT_30087 [Dioszegia hungarica]